MILQEKDIKRLVIYFIYDKQGIVDDYILYMLNAIKETGAEIEVVCNGKLTPDSREKIIEITPNVMVRENEGFDVWAYKSVLDYYGWEKLETYDEIVMMNFTIMGPVYPLQEMFDSMNKRDLDFWGITKYHLYKDADPFGTIEYGYIPEHIQSHFIAVRNSMIKSIEFQTYWNEMREIHNYQEAIGFHEAIFTKKFTEAGFVCDVYADVEDGYNNHPILCATTRMLKEKRCPIFKRRSFMQEYSNILHDTFGQEARDTLQYLKEFTDYDTEMIWDNILRVENIADIKKNLQLNYIIDEENISNQILKEHKVAVWLGVAYKTRVPLYLEYLEKIPEEIDIILVPKTDEIKKNLEEGCGKKDNFIVLECTDTAMEAALTAEKKRVREYEYICFMQDCKINENVPYTNGASLLYKQFSNLLSQGCYASKVIRLFEEEKRLGLLVSPPATHGNYYNQIGNAWDEYYYKVEELAKKMGLQVSIQFAKEPIIATDNMCWIRTKAWKNLLDYTWKSEDFRETNIETADKKESLLQVLARMHSYAVQQQGYYSAWVMSPKGAEIEVTNLSYTVEELNKIAREMGILEGSREEVMHFTRNALKDWYDYIVDGTQYFSKTKLYINVKGEYKEENFCMLRWDEGDSCYCTEDIIDFGNVEELRWDPGERAGIMVKNFSCVLEDVSGIKYDLGINQIITNGIRNENKVYFLKKDPQIYIKLHQKMHIKNLKIFGDITDEIPYSEVKNLKSHRELKEIIRCIGRKIKRLSHK